MKIRFMLLTLILGVSAMQAAFGDDQSQKASRLDVQIRVQLDYLLYLPKDYDKQEKVPLLLFLHGSGERGNNLELVKVHGPPKLIAQGKDFPCIVVSPQCPSEKWWEPYKLEALLDDLESKYKIDPERIYVTGLSMGGFGTLRLAATAPKRLAAIVPICGGGEELLARRIKDIPSWFFHGGKDKDVPVDRSQTLVDAMKKEGGDPRLTIYPDTGHDSWTEAYNDPKLWEWLFAQKRPEEKKKDEDSK